MNQQDKKDIILHTLRYCLFIFSSLVLGYILVTTLFRMLNVDFIKIDPRIFDPNYLKFLVSVGFFSGGAGIIIEHIENKKPIRNVTLIPTREKVSVLISSAFLSFFYLGTIQLAGLIQLGSFIITFLFFVFFLPQLIVFLSTTTFSPRDYDFNLFKKKFPTRKKLFLLFSAGIFFL